MTNLFYKQLDFCFTSDFLSIIFRLRNIYLTLMYFLEKMQSSVAILSDLDPLKAMYFYHL